MKEEEALSTIIAQGSGEKAELKLKLDAKEKELEPFAAKVDAAQSVYVVPTPLLLLYVTTRPRRTRVYHNVALACAWNDKL